MSSYLQKYHLQKVQPVKNRPKGPSADFHKPKQKIQKGNTFKFPSKPPMVPHRTHFQMQSPRNLIHHPKTQQLVKIKHELTDQSWRRKGDKGAQAEDAQKMSHRTHQSLNFKSAKDISTGTKFINSIQGFFNKLMQNNEGCYCGDICPHAITFFQWADTPYEIVKDHYYKLHRDCQEVMKTNPNEQSNCSIANHLSQKTIKNVVSKYEELHKNFIQIKKDINRTQSDSLTFQNKDFQDKMINILMCYGYEDLKVGYIQGMNLILSGLIYHIKEEIRAFAVFRKLIFTIRTIYFHGFKQCYEHISKIRTYLSLHVHDLYQLLQQLMVDLNIVCLPWVLSLLTCIVPLQYLHLIYLGFIKDGWSFFYRVCLAMMIYHKEKINDLYDSGEILSLFSATNQKKGQYDWEDIIEYSQSIVL